MIKQNTQNVSAQKNRIPIMTNIMTKAIIITSKDLR